MDDRSNFLSTFSGVIGVVLYLAVGFVYLVSGLGVPIPWLLLLWLVWIVGLFFLYRMWQGFRAWTPVVAAAALAFWALYLFVGSALLGWTA